VHGHPAQGLDQHGRFSHQGKYWNFRDIMVEPRPVQQPHPPFWMGAGSPEAIRRAGSEGYRLLLDQIAPIELTVERVAIYRDALEKQGEVFDGMRVGVTRAIYIIRSEDDRQNAFVQRRKTLSTIGALARGPGAERYQNAKSFADADLASENAALMGTPGEIIAQLRQLQRGGVEYVLLIDPTGSKDTLRAFADEIMPELRNGAG
jgi:alkanesulfonate monooxygenase SsuD/methylene tetrahydromethanopterin reductase-like flavin-dependent oxidoreductase (luciferase family)